MANVQLQTRELDTRDDDDDDKAAAVVSGVHRVANVGDPNSSDLIADVNILSISENNVYGVDGIAQNSLPCLNPTLSSSSQCKPSCSFNAAVNNSEFTEGLQQIDGVKYVCYKNEQQMKDIMRLIQKDLSEPYSIYTYRYFIHNWPKLCFLVSHDSSPISEFGTFSLHIISSHFFKLRFVLRKCKCKLDIAYTIIQYS